MFRSLQQHDANINNLKAIYLDVINNYQNCPKIDDLNDKDKVISWFMENYLEYEPFIYSIVRRFKFK